MPRTYDEDGQPMMSNTAMLQMLVKEIPLLSKNLTSLEQRVDGIDQKVTKLSVDLTEVKSDVKGLRLQVHQNHTSFITNQQEMETRIAVLEAA